MTSSAKLNVTWREMKETLIQVRNSMFQQLILESPSCLNSKKELNWYFLKYSSGQKGSRKWKLLKMFFLYLIHSDFGIGSTLVQFSDCGYQSGKVMVALFPQWSKPSLTLGQVNWSPVTSHCSRRCHDTNRNRLDGSWKEEANEIKSV